MRLRDYMKKTSGWVVAWVLGILIVLLLMDNIRISKIIVNNEECKVNER